MMSYRDQPIALVDRETSTESEEPREPLERAAAG